MLPSRVGRTHMIGAWNTQCLPDRLQNYCLLAQGGWRGDVGTAMLQVRTSPPHIQRGILSPLLFSRGVGWDGSVVETGVYRLCHVSCYQENLHPDPSATLPPGNLQTANIGLWQGHARSHVHAGIEAERFKGAPKLKAQMLRLRGFASFNPLLRGPGCVRRPCDLQALAALPGLLPQRVLDVSPLRFYF